MGLYEYEFYTTIFGISRAMGCFANTIWARAIGMPLERPGSMTLEQLKEFVQMWLILFFKTNFRKKRFNLIFPLSYIKEFFYICKNHK